MMGQNAQENVYASEASKMLAATCWLRFKLFIAQGRLLPSWSPALIVAEPGVGLWVR